MAVNENICTQLDALGIPWSLVRCRPNGVLSRTGEEQVFAHGRDEEDGTHREIRVHRLVAGYPVCYWERRRYSNKTFTWVMALVDGVWRSLGDPWPCIMPADREVREQIQLVKQYLRDKQTA